MTGNQISMFSLLDEYETPMIPIEEQKKGVKGWIIDISCICLRKNGCKDDWTGVETRPVILLSDTHEDKDGFMWQHVQTTKGPYSGWNKAPERIFRKRPTWDDCLKWARQHMSKSDPREIRFYSRDGNWNGIYQYEQGY